MFDVLVIVVKIFRLKEYDFFIELGCFVVLIHLIAKTTYLFDYFSIFWHVLMS